MTSKLRQNRLKEKLEMEHLHFQYLLSKGWHPLEIADNLMHFMITSLKEGIRQRNPEYSEEQILIEARRIFSQQDKLKQTKRRQKARNG